MKRYVVVFEESAQADVRESYVWGRRTWGKHEAQQWARQLRVAVTGQLVYRDAEKTIHAPSKDPSRKSKPAD